MLDSKTTKGIPYIESEEIIARAVCEKMKCEQIHMASDDAHVDRLFYRNGQLVAVGEIKSRNMTIEELESHGSYLITENKIAVGCALAGLMGVPFMLFVKLLKSDLIVYWLICNGNGELKVHYDKEVTKTRATVNGGQAQRMNAFIDLSQMKTL
tara:strand:+ start:114 stop:575 length:462 start_codon:yes stop_codon:yes gene_type:complete